MSLPTTNSFAADAYRAQDVQGADPIGLIVRVYDEASRSLALARTALTDGDAAAKGKHIQKVLRCLGELQACIDMDRGGEVARNMDRLYDYMQRRLMTGQLRDDDEAFGEVATYLTDLGDAWREASRRPQQRDRT
ncbi:MAG: flagellar export chaperone FliS [bacterium]|nr:flagellar export chaperone FliS [bacterium]